jgi:lipopolysaccharide/colanic/teichoic acid biosynthesis glycosyltransferase
MVRRQRLPEVLILVLICAGFVGAILAYQTLFPELFDFLTSDEIVLGFLASVGTFWIAVRLTGFDSAQRDWGTVVAAFCVGTGASLIVQAWLNYLDILTRSMFLIVIGGVLASVLLWIAGQLMPSRDEAFKARTLMIGFDHVSAELVPFLRYPLAAVIGGTSYPPGSKAIPYGELKSALEQLQPQQIVVTRDGAGQVDSSTLLEQRLRGARVNSTLELYEDLLGRVCCADRQPVDLMLSQALSGNQQAMVFQAIYTNLIGLALLLAIFPVLAAVFVFALLSGSGSIIEAEECCGFRNIPFLRMRFRTKRADGTYHPAGRMIAWLHLTDAPLLFNIIRGEMALFGPRPVRSEFAARLREIIPFYSMRFAVKPGIISWGGASPQGSGDRSPVLTEIEYDLYYVKHGSPVLDLEILQRLIFPAKPRDQSQVAFAPAGQ